MILIAIGGIACLLTVAGILLFACEYRRAEYPPMVRKQEPMYQSHGGSADIVLRALEAIRKIEKTK